MASKIKFSQNEIGLIEATINLVQTIGSHKGSQIMKYLGFDILVKHKAYINKMHKYIYMYV